MKKDEKEKLLRFEKLFAKQKRLLNVWKENERLYNAVHSEEQLTKLKKKKRGKLFIPAIRNSVNIIKAIFTTAFFSRGCPIEILPVGEDESSKLTDRNKVIKYYFDKKLKPNKELAKAFLSALLFKMGVVITYWNSSKKKVVTAHIPITDIAFDSECVNIDDIQEIAYKHYESNRVIKQKIKDGFYNEKRVYKKLYENIETLDDNKRKVVKVIYILNVNGGYESFTFIDNILVRSTTFENLPFQYGYALDKLPCIDEDIRKDEILCYGGDIVELLKDLQKEINQKRNLKNDIQEEILNPSIYVGSEAKVNPKDLTMGAGARIRVDGEVNAIKERPVPSEYALNTDLSILASDIQSAVGVNSIVEGQTNARDRRSATALSVVNSNSSMRIEEMIMLIKETLFEHWAKTWVKLVFKNADDKVINAITNKEFPFGKKGSRDDIEYDLRINFGMTLDKEKKINDLLGLYQITAQNPNINPKIVEKLLKKILDMRIGEDTDLTNLYKIENDGTNNENSLRENQEVNTMAEGTL